MLHDYSTEEFVDYVQSLGNKPEIDINLSDTMKTLSYDTLISLFLNKFIDILNNDKWGAKCIDTKKYCVFHAQGGQKKFSIMCHNCG